MSATPGGRPNFLKKEEFYMMQACVASFRSKDPDTQCGAILVDPTTEKVFGIGWNGMPQGSVGLPYEHNAELEAEFRDKLTYICHAEENALIFRGRAETAGATMYCTRYPCNVCAKYIVQAGIKKVIYLYEKLTKEGKRRLDCEASERLFNAAKEKVEVQKYGEITGDNSIDSCEKLMSKVFQQQFRRPIQD